MHGGIIRYFPTAGAGGGAGLRARPQRRAGPHGLHQALAAADARGWASPAPAPLCDASIYRSRLPRRRSLGVVCCR
jgi:hypothetical protein